MKSIMTQSAERQLNVISLVILMVALCTSCGLPSGGQTFTQRWLLKQPCVPPCWEGVTVGVTTQEDAFHILSKSPYVYIVDNGGLALGISPIHEGELRWLWTDQLDPSHQIPGSHTMNTIHVFSAAHRPVRLMEMNFPYGFTLRQLVNAYGNPSHTVASVITATAGLGVDSAMLPDRLRTLHLIYLAQGFRVAVSVTPAYKSQKITPDLVLDNVTAFWPDDPTGLSDSGLNPTMFLPWAGLQSFEDYCTAQGTPSGLC
jgi:hypothetical protein